jgi:hypothetical protein
VCHSLFGHRDSVERVREIDESPEATVTGRNAERP